MQTAARHLLAEYHHCETDGLNDLAAMRSLMLAAAQAIDVAVLDSTFRQFEPQGVTGVVVIAESHLSVHTWPEHRYVAVDIFTCGNVDPQRAHAVLAAKLRPGRADLMLVSRGLDPSKGPSMQVVSEDSERPEAPVAPATF